MIWATVSSWSSSLITKMSMFTLAIFCLTTCNLPWLMDLTFQVPMKYCSLPTLGFIFTTSHIHNLALFLLWLSLSFLLELFLCSSPIAYWAPTDLGSSSFSVLSFCLSYCSWSSQGKTAEVVCHSLFQWATFYQNSPLWPICLGWGYAAWLVVSLH